MAQRSASLFRVAEASLPKEPLAAVQLLSSLGYSTGPFFVPAPRFSFRSGLLLQPWVVHSLPEISSMAEGAAGPAARSTMAADIPSSRLALLPPEPEHLLELSVMPLPSLTRLTSSPSRSLGRLASTLLFVSCQVLKPRDFASLQEGLDASKAGFQTAPAKPWSMVECEE